MLFCIVLLYTLMTPFALTGVRHFVLTPLSSGLRTFPQVCGKLQVQD